MVRSHLRCDLKPSPLKDMCDNSRYYLRSNSQEYLPGSIHSLMPTQLPTIGESSDGNTQPDSCTRNQYRQRDEDRCAHSARLSINICHHRERSHSPVKVRFYRSRSRSPRPGHPVCPENGISVIDLTSPEIGQPVNKGGPVNPTCSRVEKLEKKRTFIDLTSPPRPAPIITGSIRHVTAVTENGLQPLAVQTLPHEYIATGCKRYDMGLDRYLHNVENEDTAMQELQSQQEQYNGRVVIDLTGDDSDVESRDLSSSPSAPCLPAPPTPLGARRRERANGILVLIRKRPMALEFARRMIDMPAVSGSLHHHILWTDGSLLLSGFGGSAVVWRNHAAGTWKAFKRSLEWCTSDSNVTELQGIAMATGKAFHLIEEARKNRTACLIDQLVILTDSTYCLNMIKKKLLDHCQANVAIHSWLTDITNSLRELVAMGVIVELHWVPAHMGILGNELADREARSAARMLTLGRSEMNTDLCQILGD